MITQWTAQDENSARCARNDCRESIRRQIVTLNQMLQNATWLGIMDADELIISDATLTASIGQDEAEVVAGLELS